jgi:hypothetical protein
MPEKQQGPCARGTARGQVQHWSPGHPSRSAKRFRARPGRPSQARLRKALKDMNVAVSSLFVSPKNAHPDGDCLTDV